MLNTKKASFVETYGHLLVKRVANQTNQASDVLFVMAGKLYATENDWYTQYEWQEVLKKLDTCRYTIKTWMKRNDIKDVQIDVLDN